MSYISNVPCYVVKPFLLLKYLACSIIAGVRSIPVTCDVALANWQANNPGLQATSKTVSS